MKHLTNTHHLQGRPTAAAQALARQTPNMAPPLPSDFYRQNAMAPPPPPMSQPHLPQGPPQTAMPGIASHMPQIEGFVSGGLIVEPWADGLDEIDHRELAMGRFRARQEILSEIFGPERLSKCCKATTRGASLDMERSKQ